MFNGNDHERHPVNQERPRTSSVFDANIFK